MRLSRRGAGADARRTDSTPTPGWKAFSAMRLGWRNPRTPAVPATLDLTLDEYFAATSLMGLLASQAQEPNQRWCCDWSFKMGHTMAREARRRRR
jgi:hypothetical protein